MPTADAAGLAALNGRVTAALSAFLDGAGSTLGAVSPDLTVAEEAIREFVTTGGKRLRPAFCYWGWRGAGAPDSDALVYAAASLELLHACALIHDDVMDGSATRRGRPAMHRQFAGLHDASGWSGSPDAFGASAAILLGDLCLVWADQMFGESGLPAAALRAAAPGYAQMRVELMAGQYLDVLAAVIDSASPAEATERALQVARFKTAKYTVERPLQLGGVLAGGSAELLAAYSSYGLPLGEAFQLRDDVLGVYGDPDVTGKPAGDDIREGKRTALVTLAIERATRAEAGELQRHLGDLELDADGLERCQRIIHEVGALQEVERLITLRGGEAREALTGAVKAGIVDEVAGDALDALAAAALNRVE